MNINQKESVESNKMYVGFGLCEVIAINPTRDEIIKMREIPEANQEKVKEPEYVKEISDDKGDRTRVSINVYVKNVDTGDIGIIFYNIENVVRTSKDGGKTQWVNQVGSNGWADVEDNLFSSFKNFTKPTSYIKDGEISEKWSAGAKVHTENIIQEKVYREAYVGEADFYESFFRNWLANLDIYNTTTDILLDTKKLFKGNFKELQQLVETSSVNPIVCCYYIATKDVEGVPQDIQRIHPSFILPGSAMKLIKNYGLTKEKMDLLLSKDKKTLSVIEKFFVNTFTGEYSVSSKGYFQPLPMVEYDASQNPVFTSKAIVEDTPDF